MVAGVLTIRRAIWIAFAVASACDRSAAPTRDDAAIAVAPPRDAAIDPDIPPPRPEEVLVPMSQRLGPFYIDRKETTIDDYLACIRAGQCTVPYHRADRESDTSVAIGGVTLDQARSYCAWRGKQLPTPDQWRYAAYGDGPRDYPWGSHRPICERAWLRGCSPNDTPTAPGRPAGASPFGVLDMIGNVAEWTDSSWGAFLRTCVDGPTTTGELLGGDVSADPKSPALILRDTVWPTPAWFVNRGQGIRCARSTRPPDPESAADDPELRAMLEGGGLVVEKFATAREAFARAEALCANEKHGLPIAGDVAGERGWLVAINGAPTLEAARKLAPPNTKVIAAPTGLTRMIGVATCGTVADHGTLHVTAGKQRYAITRPSGRSPYQLWLAPGVAAKLELQCKRPPAKGDCDFNMTMAGPAEVVVRSTPRSGIDGPPFETDGEYVCD